MSNDGFDNQSSGNTADPSQIKDQATQDMSAVSGQAKHDLDAITEQARQDARDLKHQAGEKIEDAKGKVKSFADDQKDLAAGQINGVAAAIGKVADELDGSDQQTVARYARDLATGLSGMGKTIEDRDVDELMGLAQTFGRKQPVAFLGAAALAGFVASRFAIASAHRRDNKPVSPQASPKNDEPAKSYETSSSTYNPTGGL